MSCDDCFKKNRLQQRTYERLKDAATAHGYELWTREGQLRLHVLAIPVAASYGTPEALVDTFADLRKGLPRPPRRGRNPNNPRDGVRENRRPDAGQRSFQLDGAPPIELVFIDRLQT